MFKKLLVIGLAGAGAVAYYQNRDKVKVAMVDWKAGHPEQWLHIQKAAEQARAEGIMLAIRSFAQAQAAYEKARAPKEGAFFNADIQEGAAPEPDYESAFFARFPSLTPRATTSCSRRPASTISRLSRSLASWLA